MKECKEKYNLCGIMESHHFGFYPSFIGDLSNLVFNSNINNEDIDNLLDCVLKKHFNNDIDKIKEGLSYCSEMITYITAANEDQYGPMRVGPVYPFNLKRILNMPFDKKSHFGGYIHFPDYTKVPTQDRILHSAMSLRMPKEIIWLDEAAKCLDKGIDILSSIDNKNSNLEKLINLLKYIYCSLITVRNIKRWHIAKTKLAIEQVKENAFKLLDEMKHIISDERDNVNVTIPLTESDSRLGWEPSMEYIGHTSNLYWKLKQLDYVENVELVNLCEEYKR